MSQKRYRIAIVGGAGTWGRHYLRVFSGHPQCDVVAIVDTARARRDEFAQRYGVANQYDTVEELLADTVPDIVSAVVPVAMNYPVVKACAEAGVRVVSCEKPISAVLAEADAMVDVCRRHGTLLGCGQAAWATPYMPQVIDWIHAGHIGTLTGIAIPGGLPVEVSGAGCVQLAVLRIVTGMEAEWVEGWELPAVDGYVAADTPAVEADVPAYGRIGLSEGITCDILSPDEDPECATYMSIIGDRGRVWLGLPRPVLIQGVGPRAQPVYPDFLDKEADDFFEGSILRLLTAFDTGEEPRSSGEDYRRALELAIAIKRSSAQGHARIHLPLEDRSQRLLPHPYRLHGGDVAGWKSIGYGGPPQTPGDLRTVVEFDDLRNVSYSDLRRLLRAVAPTDLALILTTFPKRMRQGVLSELSEAMRSAVREALGAHPDPAPDRVAAAKQRVLDVAHSL